MDNRVVCAANLSECGKYMALGVRHFDTVMRTTMGMMKSPDGSEIKWKKGEQGFIDRNRNFLTRESAWEVATKAGQIIRRCGGDEGKLFSENLY